MNLSPLLAARLGMVGHDAVHVRDLAAQEVPDDEIIRIAAREERVIITADLDFGEPLTQRLPPTASVLILRLKRPTADRLLNKIAEALLRAGDELERGAIAIVSDHGVRVRSHPISRPP